MSNAPDAAQRLKPSAVRIPTRKRQKLAFSPAPDETLYLVRKGVFLARATMPDSRRQILSLLYPGDIVRAAAMPPLDDAEITAASDNGEVWRLRWAAVKDLVEADPALARHISDRLAEQAARLALHNAIIAGLNGDERVAALITELALRIGTPTPAGVVFDMPLTRMDIAEHLALNADTVSRIISRMRAKGLIATVGRSRLICRDFSELAAACPLTATLINVHGAADASRSFPA